MTSLLAIISKTGHAIVADAPTLVLALGLVRPISWTRRPQISIIIGIPSPVSKPPSPLAAADKVGHTNHIAPSKINIEEVATNFSRRSVRCLMAAWIAPSTSDHASMNVHYGPQTYSMPSK